MNCEKSSCVIKVEVVKKEFMKFCSGKKDGASCFLNEFASCIIFEYYVLMDPMNYIINPTVTGTSVFEIKFKDGVIIVFELLRLARIYEIEMNYEKITEGFDDMNLTEELLKDIYACDFKKPSAIQQRAFFRHLKGHGVIAHAQSGIDRKSVV